MHCIQTVVTDILDKRIGFGSFPMEFYSKEDIVALLLMGNQTCISPVKLYAKWSHILEQLLAHFADEIKEAKFRNYKALD